MGKKGGEALVSPGRASQAGETGKKEERK